MSRHGAKLLLFFCCVMAVLDGAAVNASPTSLRGDHPYDRARSDVMLVAEASSSAGIALAKDAPAMIASSAENLPGPAPSALSAPMPPGQAPSLIQRLEGREGDLTVWIVIAVIFFLFGWLGGSIYSRRRERSRRGRLRF